MLARRRFRLFALGVFALAIGLACALGAPAASAQCGGECPKSPCFTCHQAVAPVDDLGPWHVAHAQQDYCWNCHGGNDRVADEDLAHVSLMRLPLEDIYLSCYACHPDDYQNLAKEYAAALGVTLVSYPTPTAHPSATPMAAGPLVPDLPAAAASGLFMAYTVPALWLVSVAILLLLVVGVRHRHYLEHH